MRWGWVRDYGDIPLLASGDASAPSLQSQEALLFEVIERRTRAYRLALGTLDAGAQRWLERSGSPFAGELEDLVARLGRPGVALFNLSQEWACTSLAVEFEGRPMLLRAFDWSLDGLGAGLVAQSRRSGDALGLTWPHFIGELTVLSPGRFAAAINQAPFKRRAVAGVTFPAWLDWMADLRETWGKRSMPPSHLLRHVAETAADFDEALERLSTELICRPVIFVLVGVSPGQTAVIERQPDAFQLRRSETCAANHWALADWPERGRDDSHARAAAMPGLVGGVRPSNFDWLRSPVLNNRTRYAAILDALACDVLVERFENERRVGETSRVRRAVNGDR